MIKILFISLTNKCDRSCGYCPIEEWRNNPKYPDSLTLEKCIKAIENLKPTHVEITGGEPTLVPWLNELTNYLDSIGIIYLVKSNGYKHCKKQITAWHDGEMPKNYDKILIIKDTENWQGKENYCKKNNVPYKIIGFNNVHHEIRDYEAMQLFLCPDGRFKQCHEMELDSTYPEWKDSCPFCKAVGDFLIFLEPS